MENKIDSFKEFVRSNPFLIGYIRKGKKSWQDFYEMYDLYGEDEDAWLKFLEEDSVSEDKGTDTKNNGGYFDELVRMARNVDMNKVQEGISSLQKTLGLFGELFAGKGNNSTKEYNPRPLYRRFED